MRFGTKWLDLEAQALLASLRCERPEHARKALEDFREATAGQDPRDDLLQRARSGPVNPVQERQLGLIYSAAFGLQLVAYYTGPVAGRTPAQ